MGILADRIGYVLVVYEAIVGSECTPKPLVTH